MLGDGVGHIGWREGGARVVQVEKWRPLRLDAMVVVRVLLRRADADLMSVYDVLKGERYQDGVEKTDGQNQL